jgi:EAL domain-containing protein (putative c-di-GMP-specific phosphodiesterase class I)
MLQVLGDLDRIPSLDYWLIGNVCDQIRRWSAEGKELVPVSVNICGTTLLEPDFPEKARALVADRNVRVDLIEFELLESVVVDVASSALDQLERCRALGFSIALDDFGAGQTSLSYLARLPVDTVKIDRSFVDGIVEDTTASNLLFRIISMCKSLGKITIVEGVESVGQYLLLRSFHCDQIQGYYFAKPEPVAVTGDLLTEQNLLLEPRGLGGL